MSVRQRKHDTSINTTPTKHLNPENATEQSILNRRTVKVGIGIAIILMLIGIYFLHLHPETIGLAIKPLESITGNNPSNQHLMKQSDQIKEGKEKKASSMDSSKLRARENKPEKEEEEDKQENILKPITKDTDKTKSSTKSTKQANEKKDKKSTSTKRKYPTPNPIHSPQITHYKADAGATNEDTMKLYTFVPPPPHNKTIHPWLKRCSMVDKNIRREKIKQDKFQRNPTILFWETENINYNMYESFFKHTSQSYMHCDYKCTMTTDQKQKDKASAIIYWAVPKQPKESKCAHQVWMVSSIEAIDMFILDKLPAGEGVVDMEITFRKNKKHVTWMSYFPWYMQYDKILASSPPPVLRSKQPAARGDKHAAVASFITNCGAMSDRLKVIEELQKVIKVDNYGRCLNNKQTPPEFESMGRSETQKNAILSKYHKFLLSFENQVLDDYVTEKFFGPFEAGVIPVYLGAGNIDEYTPVQEGLHPAYIKVSDFAGNYTRLAEYLDYLDKNDEAYLK